MKQHLEFIHTKSLQTIQNNPQWNMPYVPAIKVLSGKPLYISGVNATPIYHSHPHKSEEFDYLDFNPENQARLTMENLIKILRLSNGSLENIVQLFIFIVDIPKYGDRLGKIISNYFGNHLYTSSVIGITELITDSRLILEITAVAYIEEV